MSASNDSTADHAHHQSRTRCCGSGKSNWSAVNIATMVVGFVLFWPLGLLVLFWIVAGRDVKELPESIHRLWASITSSWRGHSAPSSAGPRDNAMFNEFQQAQYERIREIRDEIRDRARRFGEFRARAKRRADEEEFNQFMSDAPTRGDG